MDEVDAGNLRKLSIWLNGLPREAAVWRINGQQWTVEDELLAQLVERVDTWGLFRARQTTAKKHQSLLPKKPVQFDRPFGSETKDEVITDAAEIARWFS